MSGFSARACSMNASADGLSGWSTVSSSASAASLTGEAVTLERWRPVGLSARVTTPTTSKPSPTSAVSEGTANSGVPKNRTRIGSRLRRVLGEGFGDVLADQLDLSFARLLPLLHQPAPLERPDAVEEHDAVEVVDLVLERPRQQLGAFDAPLHAVFVERLDHHAGRAFDVAINVRDGEAAFLFLDRALAFHDHGVHQRVAVLRVGLDHGDAPELAHLVGRQPDALVRAHRVEQVRDERAVIV